MFAIVRGVFRDKGADVRRKVFGIYGFLIGFNVAAWVYTLAAFHNHPVLLGSLRSWLMGLVCAMQWMPTISPPSTT